MKKILAVMLVFALVLLALAGCSNAKCAHPGCNRNVASSGDTNCCATHSNRCLECGKYIDEDATWCMSCLTNAIRNAQ